jgi:profilin
MLTSGQVSDAERKAIADSFNDKSDPKGVIANGIKIAGEKYMTIEASDDSLKAKKVRTPATAHTLGMCSAHVRPSLLP